MTLAEFHFLRPACLLVLIPYALVVALMARHKLSQGNWSAVCDAALLPYLLQKDAIHQSRWPLVGGALAAGLLILALAGPSWERLPSPAFRNDAALIIALDLSRSMDAGDVKPSRLTMARFKIADILKQRKDGQTALLVYAGDAFTVTPLTNDTETIVSQLSALNTDIMPSEGSNTSAALEKATELFKQSGLQKGHILLVTDGVDVDSTLAAVDALGNYKLSVLGVGTAEGAPIALPDGGFLKDRQGAIIVPKLDRPALEKLASAGHGNYQSLSATNNDIQAILSSLDDAKQKTGSASNIAIEVWNDRGPWLLLLALPLAALGFRKGVLCFALLVLLPFPKTSYALEWQDLWHTKDQQAMQAFQEGNYAKAAIAFENPSWKAAAHAKAGHNDQALALLKNSKTSDDFYNKGNVLAQDGKLEDALKAYQKALALDPNNADAKYNEELVAKELAKQREQQKQQEQQKQNQQKQDQQQDDQKPQSQNKPEENSDNASQDPNQSDDSKDSEQKPEQKPEQTPDQAEKNAADQQKNEQTAKDEKAKAQEKAEQEAKTEAARLEKQKKADAEKPTEGKKPQAAVVEEKPYDEKQQANEQWLKRIPDDPAGLLKRKFKYQYGQREHPSNDGAYAW
jgi:Ca-activated chloride channel family protein